jgi:hypothetical protein
MLCWNDTEEDAEVDTVLGIFEEKNSEYKVIGINKANYKFAKEINKDTIIESLKSDISKLQNEIDAIKSKISKL